MALRDVFIVREVSGFREASGWTLQQLRQNYPEVARAWDRVARKWSAEDTRANYYDIEYLYFPRRSGGWEAIMKDRENYETFGSQAYRVFFIPSRGEWVHPAELTSRDEAEFEGKSEEELQQAADVRMGKIRKQMAAAGRTGFVPDTVQSEPDWSETQWDVPRKSSKRS